MFTDSNNRNEDTKKSLYYGKKVKGKRCLPLFVGKQFSITLTKESAENVLSVKCAQDSYCVIRGTHTVSYTHLDVYKRQV